MNKKTQQRVLCGITAIALAFTYFAIGFAICAGFPHIAHVASLDHSAFEASSYTHDELVTLADKTRAYTIEDDHGSDETLDQARTAFAEEVLAAALVSMEDPAKASAWDETARNVVGQWEAEDTDPLTAMLELAELDPSYALGQDALDHLDDVNEVVSSVRMPLFGCTLIAAFCLMSLVMMFGARAAGRALLIGGCLTFVIFIILGLWGIVGFDGLFAWMHSLFFADGSWTFPANSLLIQMYPVGFWVSLGLAWLVSSCIVAAASIVIGLVITRRKNAAEEEPRQPAGLQA